MNDRSHHPDLLKISMHVGDTGTHEEKRSAQRMFEATLEYITASTQLRSTHPDPSSSNSPRSPATSHSWPLQELTFHDIEGYAVDSKSLQSKSGRRVAREFEAVQDGRKCLQHPDT
jgi:hypothetical protein